jgi:hypothetical protein
MCSLWGVWNTSKILSCPSKCDLFYCSSCDKQVIWPCKVLEDGVSLRIWPLKCGKYARSLIKFDHDDWGEFEDVYRVWKVIKMYFQTWSTYCKVVWRGLMKIEVDWRTWELLRAQYCMILLEIAINAVWSQSRLIGRPYRPIIHNVKSAGEHPEYYLQCGLINGLIPPLNTSFGACLLKPWRWWVGGPAMLSTYTFGNMHKFWPHIYKPLHSSTLPLSTPQCASAEAPLHRM